MVGVVFDPVPVWYDCVLLCVISFGSSLELVNGPWELFRSGGAKSHACSSSRSPRCHSNQEFKVETVGLFSRIKDCMKELGRVWNPPQRALLRSLRRDVRADPRRSRRVEAVYALSFLGVPLYGTVIGSPKVSQVS